MDFHLPSWCKSVENIPSLDFGRIPDCLTAHHWDTPSMFRKKDGSNILRCGFVGLIVVLYVFHFIPLSHWSWLMEQRFREGDHSSQSCGRKIWDLCAFSACVRARRTDSACAYECGGAMLKVSGAAPAPSGHEWRFHCSVGVDCSDAEPRCIWLAVLRGISPRASPRPTPITSPRRRGSRRLIQRHRLSWVRDTCLGFALEVLAEVRMTRLQCHESCFGWSFDQNSRLECSR